jgi:hypothetical protein
VTTLDSVTETTSRVTRQRTSVDIFSANVVVPLSVLVNFLASDQHF